MSAATSAGHAAAPSRATSGQLTAAERTVLAGVIVATFGVAVAMLPGGFSQFGPAKATVLLAGCLCIAIGFALDPHLPTHAIARAAAQRGAWPGFALVGLACLATLTSIDRSQSLTGHYPEYQGLLLLLCSALAALGAYTLAEKDATWRVLGRAATVAMLVVAAYAIAQFAGVDPVATERVFVVRRVRSMLGNASNLGVFCCLALPLVVARARAERGAWRLAAWAAVGGGVLALTFSLSRGAWLGALAGALTWLLAEGRSWERARRVRVGLAAAGIAVAAVALVALLVPNAATRLAALRDPAAGTAGWRAEVLSGSARLIGQRPLLGYGPASFRYAFPPVRTAAMQAGETGVQAIEDPHNLFASAGVSAGVLAIVALAWLLAETVLAVWRLERDDRWELAGPALAAAVVGGAVALQFHFATLDTAPLLATLVASALGRHAASTRRAPEVEPTRPATLLAARVGAGLLAAALALGVAAAGGLVLADRAVARGYALLDAGRPWSEARASFERAPRFAPWEPAMVWALGRGATQAVAAGDAAALGDATQALSSARTRLPLDSLLVAQLGEVYVVAGVGSHDAALLRQSLPVLDEAITLDPQNGYRWAAKGIALAGTGDVTGALAALERAVQYAPNDAQAWSALGDLYERTGQADRAAQARARASELSATTP